MSDAIVDETSKPRIAILSASAADDTCTFSFAGRRVRLYRVVVLGLQEDGAAEAIYSVGIADTMFAQQIWSEALPPVTTTTVLTAHANMNLACLELGTNGYVELNHDGASAGEVNALLYFDYLS